MSTTQQGPGWWQAPDGRWYPPQQAIYQGPPPFGSTPYPQNAYQPRSTSGLAIVSFVLSLVWLAGLGSLLAVIFGIVAHSDINRSKGAKSGGGLATAGIVIGIVGMLGAGTLFVSIAALDHAVHVALTPTVVPLGTTVDVSAADASGINTVTVMSVKYPVVDTSGQPDPTPGKEYAAVAMKVCAGSSGAPNGVDMFLFSLLTPDGAEGGPFPAETAQPSLNSTQGIGPNQCVSGFQTFEIDQGAMPNRVRYWPDPIRNYQWTLAPG